MSFESFEEIINFAIEKEKEAAAFYDDASRQEPYSGAKETFEDFAKEERKHQAMLEGFLKGEKRVANKSSSGQRHLWHQNRYRCEE